MAYRAAVLEACGRLYVKDVVANFPPQIKRETGLDGVQVSIRDILLWVADARKITEPKTAKVLRDIATKYYPPSEFDQDRED